MRSREVFVAAARYAVRSASFAQQALAAIPDRGLGCFGKSLQQPGQHDFQPDMIVRDIEMARRRLAQRADPKDHAIVLPSLLVDLQHGNAGSRARQSGLEASRRLFAAEMMRNRNDERCGHVRHSSVSVTACNRESPRTKGAIE